MKQKKWHLVSLPAIATHDFKWMRDGEIIYERKEGDLLHPERNSHEAFEDIKKDIGSYNFSSQYQQNPQTLDDGVIKVDWLKRCIRADLPKNPTCVILSWDTSCKTGTNNDYSVCTVWLVVGTTPRSYWLAGIYRQKLEYPDLKRTAEDKYQHYNERYQCPVFILIEDKSSGTQLAQDLRRNDFPVSTISPSSDKITRVLGASALIEEGLVIFPKDLPGIEEFIKEVLIFPNGKHDDQVDSMTQALLWKSHFIDIRKSLEITPMRSERQSSQRQRSSRNAHMEKYAHLNDYNYWLMGILGRD